MPLLFLFLFYFLHPIYNCNTKFLIPQLPHPVQQGDRAPDAASTDSSFDSPQLMQGCAEGLLLLAQVNTSLDHYNMLTGQVMLEAATQQ